MVRRAFASHSNRLTVRDATRRLGAPQWHGEVQEGSALIELLVGEALSLSTCTSTPGVRQPYTRFLRFDSVDGRSAIDHGDMGIRLYDRGRRRQTTPSSFSPPTSRSLMPSQLPNTSVVCSPSRGARVIFGGFPSKRTGKVGMRNSPF